MPKCPPWSGVQKGILTVTTLGSFCLTNQYPEHIDDKLLELVSDRDTKANQFLGVRVVQVTLAALTVVLILTITVARET